MIRAAMAELRPLRGTRRDLAVVMSDWMTAHEAARALGKPTGSIFGVLGRMHREGLLVADCDPDPPTRGTQYRFNDADFGGELRKALDEADGLGSLPVGAQMLMVRRHGGLTKPSKVLASSKVAGLVSWCALLADGWMLALVVGADMHRVQTLTSALERADCRCQLLAVADLISAETLRSRSETLSGKKALR